MTRILPAYAMASRCYVLRKANGWMVDRAQETAEAIRLARRAVELGRDDATALCSSALTLGYFLGDIHEGAELAGRALALNSNVAAAWHVSSWIKTCQGELDTAIEHAARALRLSPLEPATYLWQSTTALAHFCAGRYSDAVLWAEVALRDQADFTFALRILSASHALAGRPMPAQRAMAKLLQADPQLRMGNLGNVISPLQPEHLARYIEGLRLAGLPE
jgi:tetratricopeptide (TPR) repeat protein